jgi:1,4-alpha-glucan branching enzyme
VTFSLDAPTGSYVAVGGTFCNWRPQVMTKGQDGNWHITLQLARGMYQYRFQVDARWREDPKNRRNTPNAHGSFNSVCEVR